MTWLGSQKCDRAVEGEGADACVCLAGGCLCPEYVANCVLGFRDDFIEGVDCTVRL